MKINASIKVTDDDMIFAHIPRRADAAAMLSAIIREMHERHNMTYDDIENLFFALVGEERAFEEQNERVDD